MHAPQSHPPSPVQSTPALVVALLAFGCALLVALFHKSWFTVDVLGDNRMNIGLSGYEICGIEKRQSGYTEIEQEVCERAGGLSELNDRGKFGGVPETFADIGLFAGTITALGLIAAAFMLGFQATHRIPAAGLRIAALIALASCSYFQLRVMSLPKGVMGPAAIFGLGSLGMAVALAHRLMHIVAGVQGSPSAPGWTHPWNAAPGGSGHPPPHAPAWSAAPRPSGNPPPPQLPPAMPPLQPPYSPPQQPRPAPQMYGVISRPSPPATPDLAATVLGVPPGATGGHCQTCQRPLTFASTEQRWRCHGCATKGGRGA
jgi:hypothetical protein